MTTVYQAANALAGAGLSIIPADPLTKKPLVESWKGYQQAAATTDQLRDWFSANGHPAPGALAIICGAVSQGITVIDFDTMADKSTLYDDWAALVEEAVPGLVARLVLVGTPSGGRHIYFRCSVCEGNTKLAESHKRETWIETRGEGGYVLAPLSPGYKTLQGSLITIPTLEPAERSLLLTAAKVLTKYVPTRGPHTDTDSLPGAALNAKTSLDDIERWLTGAGWQRVGSKHDGTRLLRRPGKSDAGWSATLGRGGTRNFYVFSSNAAPFEMDTDYHAFAVYTMLYHNGEYSAAARQLAADGLGGTRQRPKEQKQEYKSEYSSQDSQQAPAEEPWVITEQPITTKPFDVEWLMSPTLITLVATAMAATDWPGEFLAAPILSICGGCIGTARKVTLNDLWSESACLWSAVIGEPGSGKTPALSFVQKPLMGLQHKWHKEWKERVEQYQQELAAWEALPKQDRDDKPIPPEPQRKVTVSNVTLEALVTVLANNPRGVVALRDELLGWLLSFNQYKKNGGADRQDWLSIYNGQPIVFDRKADNFSEFVGNPFVALYGGIQPDRLPELRKGAEDGLVDRFLLFFPDVQITRTKRFTFPQYLITNYKNLLERLMEMQAGKNEEDDDVPMAVLMSDAVFERFSNRDWIFKQLARDPDTTKSMRNAYSKLSGHAARVALILHCCQCADDPSKLQFVMDAATIDAAWNIVECAASHLSKAFGTMSVKPDDERAGKAVEWIRRHGNTATSRDLIRANVAGVKRSSEALALLKELADRHLGVLTTEKTHGPETTRFTIPEAK